MKRFLPLFFAYFAKKIAEKFASSEKNRTFASLSKNKAFLKKFGKVVEWSITAVLKTAVLRGTGGSNPSLSAERTKGGQIFDHLFCFSPLQNIHPITIATNENKQGSYLAACSSAFYVHEL